jgi:hypothetical protein
MTHISFPPKKVQNHCNVHVSMPMSMSMSPCLCFHVHVSMSMSPCLCLHAHVSISMSLCPCVHVSISQCFHVSCICFHIFHVSIFSKSSSPCLYVHVSHVFGIPRTENRTKGKGQLPFVCCKRKTGNGKLCFPWSANDKW